MRETCGHCKGSGVCRSGPGEESCDGCLKKAGIERSWLRYQVVQCGACGGKGYHREAMPHSAPRPFRSRPIY